MAGNQNANISDIPEVHVNSVAQVDVDENMMAVTTVLHTPAAATIDESGKRKRGRPRKSLQGSSVSPQITMPEDAKNKLGGPTRSTRHSGRMEENEIGDITTERGQLWKFEAEDLHKPSWTHSDHSPRECLDYVLMTFDSLRRRLEQLDEVQKTKIKQIHFKALKNMIAFEHHLGEGRRIGEIPGVQVGDIFYFKVEMRLVGLHCKDMAGIDYMQDEQGIVATCIVASSGDRGNNASDPDFLIYTGEGKNCNQKLKGGNFALDASNKRGTLIRVIRSETDPIIAQSVYIYDGLYKVTEIWMERNKSGFKEFKHKLERETGQPDGIAVWKRTIKWREDSNSRDHVIVPDMSAGAEDIEVCVVNEVDDEGAPSNFTYTTKLDLTDHIISGRSMQGCKCKDKCLPGENACSCVRHNGDGLPYSSSGLLVIRRPMVYECTHLCACSDGCRNRRVQKGSDLHFEVFKTTNRGWGLRSWDPIRAGTFICEYAGQIIDRDAVNGEDDYIFEATRSPHNLSWNCVSELLYEPTFSDPNDTFRDLPIIISAKQTGNVARFMNHSCTPNVFWQPVMYGHAEEGYPHIAFFAIKHIPPMVELVFDYGQGNGDPQFGINSGRRKSKQCLCQTANCRGFTTN